MRVDTRTAQNASLRVNKPTGPPCSTRHHSSSSQSLRQWHNSTFCVGSACIERMPTLMVARPCSLLSLVTPRSSKTDRFNVLAKSRSLHIWEKRGQCNAKFISFVRSICCRLLLRVSPSFPPISSLSLPRRIFARVNADNLFENARGSFKSLSHPKILPNVTCF